MSMTDYEPVIERKGNFQVTHTGTKFYAIDPRPEEVFIEDIAHALSNACRYAGHVSTFYSVAEHSVRCSRMVDPKFALAALLHDASEAYLVDIPRPIKYLDEFAAYTVIEDGIMEVISEKFGFNWPMDPEVKEADDSILVQEWKSLMPMNDDLLSPGFFNEVAAYDGPKIYPWSPAVAKRAFLDAFEFRTRVY